MVFLVCLKSPVFASSEMPWLASGEGDVFPRAGGAAPVMWGGSARFQTRAHAQGWAPRPGACLHQAFGPCFGSAGKNVLADVCYGLGEREG